MTSQDQDTQQRITTTLKVMDVLSSWGISASQQSEVLALQDGTRSRHMHKFKEGTPFPDEDELNVRIDHIIGISDALRTSYPRNLEMGAFWIKKRVSSRFANRAPLTCILEDGLEGLLAVRIHLDCAFDWHLDDAAAKK